MSLALRPATEADREFSFQAVKAAFKEYVEQVFGWNEEKQRLLHTERFGSQPYSVVVWNGQEVGIMSVDPAPDCIRVNQIYLLPEFQNQRIGRQCMQLVMEQARDQQLPVRLRVLKVNPRARAFYERLGFRKVSESVTHDNFEWAPSR